MWRIPRRDEWYKMRGLENGIWPNSVMIMIVVMVFCIGQNCTWQLHTNGDKKEELIDGCWLNGEVLERQRKKREKKERRWGE